MAKLNFLINLEDNSIEITSQAKDAQGRPYLSKKISSDDKVEEVIRPLAASMSEGTDAENQEMAFKVMFFFVTFIAVCFGLLYVYHRMSQSADARKKESFFEFMAAQMEQEGARSIGTRGYRV